MARIGAALIKKLKQNWPKLKFEVGIYEYEHVE
jgi:hypothetical protein